MLTSLTSQLINSRAAYLIFIIIPWLAASKLQGLMLESMIVNLYLITLADKSQEANALYQFRETISPICVVFCMLIGVLLARICWRRLLRTESISIKPLMKMSLSVLLAIGASYAAVSGGLFIAGFIQDQGSMSQVWTGIYVTLLFGLASIFSLLLPFVAARRVLLF
jgi:hypothetical protein